MSHTEWIWLTELNAALLLQETELYLLRQVQLKNSQNA